MDALRVILALVVVLYLARLIGYAIGALIWVVGQVREGQGRRARAMALLMIYARATTAPWKGNDAVRSRMKEVLGGRSATAASSPVPSVPARPDRPEPS